MAREEKDDEDIFLTEGIKIEEMAIDGICGVYYDVQIRCWNDKRTNKPS